MVAIHQIPGVPPHPSPTGIDFTGWCSLIGRRCRIFGFRESWLSLS